MRNLQEQWIGQLSAVLEELAGAEFSASSVVPASHAVELVWAELGIEMEPGGPGTAPAVFRQKGYLRVGVPDFAVTQIAQLSRGEPLDPSVELGSTHILEWRKVLDRTGERLAATISRSQGAICRVNLLQLSERPELRVAEGDPQAVSARTETAWVIQGGNAELHVELAGELTPEDAAQAKRSGASPQVALPAVPPAPPEKRVAEKSSPAGDSGSGRGEGSRHRPGAVEPEAATTGNQRLDLLLDVELEATLRFGAREMPLREVLELGPGDVVQLDRHVHEPVDLIVGDKIVARGEVVLVNGNFGLRVTQVAEPKSRLESVRCLF